MNSLATVILILFSLFSVISCQNGTNNVGSDIPDGEKSFQLILSSPTIGVETPLVVGDYFPNYSLNFDNGTSINLAEPNKPVMIKLWATWCSICRSQEPAFNQYSQSISEEALSVKFSYDYNSTTLVDYLTQNEDTGYHVFDRKQNGLDLRQMIGKSGIPRVVVIDSAGKITYIGPFNTNMLDIALSLN